MLMINAMSAGTVINDGYDRRHLHWYYDQWYYDQKHRDYEPLKNRKLHVIDETQGILIKPSLATEEEEAHDYGEDGAENP